MSNFLFCSGGLNIALIKKQWSTGWQKQGHYSLLWWLWRQGQAKCVWELFLASWCHVAAELRNPPGWSCEGGKGPQKRKHKNEWNFQAFECEVTEQQGKIMGQANTLSAFKIGTELSLLSRRGDSGWTPDILPFGIKSELPSFFFV